LVQEANEKGWAASIESFEEQFSSIPPCDSLAYHIGAVDKKLITLVVTIEDQGSVDVAPELDNKSKRMIDLFCLNIADTSR